MAFALSPATPSLAPLLQWHVVPNELLCALSKGLHITPSTAASSPSSASAPASSVLPPGFLSKLAALGPHARTSDAISLLQSHPPFSSVADLVIERASTLCAAARDATLRAIASTAPAAPPPASTPSHAVIDGRAVAAIVWSSSQKHTPVASLARVNVSTTVYPHAGGGGAASPRGAPTSSDASSDVRTFSLRRNATEEEDAVRHVRACVADILAAFFPGDGLTLAAATARTREAADMDVLLQMVVNVVPSAAVEGSATPPPQPLLLSYLSPLLARAGATQARLPVAVLAGVLADVCVSAGHFAAAAAASPRGGVDAPPSAPSHAHSHSRSIHCVPRLHMELLRGPTGAPQEASRFILHSPLDGVVRISGVKRATVLAPASQSMTDMHVLVCDCVDATVILPSACRVLTVAACVRLKLYTGPVAHLVTVDGCDGCTVAAAGAHMTFRSLSDCTLSVWSVAPPLLSSPLRSTRFEPFALTYSGLRADAERVGVIAPRVKGRGSSAAREGKLDDADCGVEVDTAHENQWRHALYAGSSSSGGSGAARPLMLVPLTSGSSPASAASETGVTIVPPEEFILRACAVAPSDVSPTRVVEDGARPQLSLALSTGTLAASLPSHDRSSRVDSLPLPEPYATALASRSAACDRMRASIAASSPTRGSGAALQRAVQAAFAEWLLSSARMHSCSESLRPQVDKLHLPPSPDADTA